MRLPALCRRAPSAFAAALCLSALGPSGCGGDSGQDPDFAQLAAEEQEQQALQLDLYCDCWADFAVPFDSKEACIAGLTIASDPAVEQCRVDAYALAPESSQANLECRLQVMSDTSACMTDTYTCTDTTTFAECDAVRAEGLAACPPLATIVVDAHIECAQ